MVNVPRFCPVCKEQLWSDDQLMDPQFYRQRHAQQYYNDHTTLKHPEFAKWDRKIQRYYAVAAIVDGVSFILFFGLTDIFPARIRPSSVFCLPHHSPYPWSLYLSGRGEKGISETLGGKNILRESNEPEKPAPSASNHS